MNQLTLRQIPEPLEKKIRTIARRKGESLNKTVISLLKQALGMQTHPTHKKYRDVTKVLGGWSETDLEEFEKNTALFEQVDEDLWK